MDWQTEAIINSLDDAIVTLNDQHQIVFLNEAAAKVFGCDRFQALGTRLASHPALAHAWSQLRLEEFPWAESPSKLVRRIEARKEGIGPLPMEASVTRVSMNGVTFYTAVLRDNTLQQQMENALFHARKHQAIGALASGIAHDFNNILTAIISQLDLAIYSSDCPSGLRANLAYAQASARRGAELVSKLQMFSRQTKPKLSLLDLHEVVEQVVFVLRRSIDPRIEIVSVPPTEKLGLVKADISQIMHAFVNLGLNARDAMTQGGKIIIQLSNVTIAPVEARPPRKAGDFVRLTVADTGKGMPPETLARLFEPYFSTKDLSRGPGLGLSITFSVVAEHGGWMEAESRLGQGTQFHVFLPRTRETAPSTGTRDILMAETRALEGKERILIVDDEEPVRMVMRAVLTYRGYQVVEAENGEEAIRKFDESPKRIDLILMDLHMPKMNGQDALLAIRKRCPSVKAVLLSGGLQEREPDNALEVEGVRFLQKPFDNQQLVATVRSILDEGQRETLS